MSKGVKLRKDLPANATRVGLAEVQIAKRKFVDVSKQRKLAKRKIFTCTEVVSSIESLYCTTGSVSSK